jgi:hypothetical protein
VNARKWWLEVYGSEAPTPDAASAVNRLTALIQEKLQDIGMPCSTTTCSHARVARGMCLYCLLLEPK